MDGRTDEHECYVPRPLAGGGHKILCVKHQLIMTQKVQTHNVVLTLVVYIKLTPVVT